MIYKFKSKAAGDVIMTGPAGDAILKLIGKEPAAKGIIEVSQMADAMRAIESAIAADDAARAQARNSPDDADNPSPATGGVTLRQRAWPLVEMMKRSGAENADIVWGV